MDAETAWQSALGQLQMDMPKASFDTWVRDATLVSYQDDTFAIGVRNAYAREWLESRLSSTVTRLLTGIMNRVLDVQFVVADADSETVEETQEDSNSNGEGFTAEVVDATRYSEEVHPDRIVLIPGYSLRLLEHGDLTAKEMSLWLGFRQAVYSKWKKGQGTVKNIPHWEATRFAMMSRASYFRELAGREDIAGGLVEIVPEPAPPTGGKTNRRFKCANRYRVHMSPRLTRKDCAVLEMILTAKTSMAATREEGHQIVLAALKDLAGHDPAEYLEQNVETGEAWPRSVLEIVRRVLGIKGDMPDDLADAAEQVFDRIVNAYGKALITHYFLREVVPVLELNHAQAWAIIVLRDRCWFDYDTNTQKEFAIVPGGLDTLARWVGVSRKTVDRWLAADNNFSAFVLKADLNKIENIPDAWNARGVDIFLVHQQEPLLSETLEGIEIPVETKRDSILDKVRLVPGQSETRYRTKRDSILDKMRLDLDKVRLDIGQSETPLNNLNKPLLNPYKPLESPPTAAAQSARRVGVGSMAFWDFNFLMTNNAVDGGAAMNLLRINKEFGRDISSLARGFVSWLLYAYSPSGTKITDPVGLAVRRLQENVHAGAGGDLDRLADLKPYELRALFDADLADKLDTEASIEAEIYAVNLASLRDEYKRQLRRRLFGA